MHKRFTIDIAVYLNQTDCQNLLRMSSLSPSLIHMTGMLPYDAKRSLQHNDSASQVLLRRCYEILFGIVYTTQHLVSDVDVYIGASYSFYSENGAHTLLSQFYNGVIRDYQDIGDHQDRYQLLIWTDHYGSSDFGLRGKIALLQTSRLNYVQYCQTLGTQSCDAKKCYYYVQSTASELHIRSP